MLTIYCFEENGEAISSYFCMIDFIYHFFRASRYLNMIHDSYIEFLVNLKKLLSQLSLFG